MKECPCHGMLVVEHVINNKFVWTYCDVTKQVIETRDVNKDDLTEIGQYND
jgi:hypothetical protein